MKQLLVLILMALILFPSTGFAALGPEPALAVSAKDRHISVKASNVSYQAILKKIAADTGIKVQILEGVPDRTVTVDLKEIPYLGISALLEAMGITNYGIAIDHRTNDLYVYVVKAGTNLTKLTKGKTIIRQVDFKAHAEITRVKGKEIVTKPLDKSGLSISYIKDELLLKFKTGTTAKEINEILARYNLIASPDATLSGLGYTKIVIPDGREVPDVAKLLAKERIVKSPEPNYIQKVLAITDPLYQEQWYAASSRFDSAWPILKSSSLVTVAVIDTGAQANHPDLAGKILKGYNVITGKADAADDNGHGTFVSGIIAANANSIGIKGMCNNARILPVKVMDANGAGTYEDVAKGIIFAADSGAKVINLSIGGYGYSPMLSDAVSYAQSKGCVVVAAGGNDGIEMPVYPAAYPDVIGVAALATDDSIWSSSNSGSHIVVSAPGSNILSTVSGNGYGIASGTSAATPMVSSLAAILSVERADLSASVIARLIQQTARDLGEKGKDKIYGAGAIDAVAALGQQVKPFHDVAVERLYLDSNAIQLGKDAYIDIVISNLGSYPVETADLKVTLNGAIALEQKDIAIARKIIFTLPIKLADKQVSNYTITAQVAATIDDNPNNNSKIITNKFKFDEKQKLYVLLKDRPFVHSWVAWQAFQMLPQYMRDDMYPYFWGGATESLLFGDGKIWTDNYCDPATGTGGCPIWGADLGDGESIVEGTWEEDQSTNSLDHFWDPDHSISDGLYTPAFGTFKSAINKASDWWNIAINNFPDNASKSYYALGRVVHLLSDMGVPDHVHLDPHLDGTDFINYNDISNYEEYTKLYFRNYTNASAYPIDIQKDLPLAQPADPAWFSGVSISDDYSLTKLFYNFAQFTQHFDSSGMFLITSGNPNGNNLVYSNSGPIAISPPLKLPLGDDLLPQNGQAIKSYKVIAYPVNCGQPGIDDNNSQCGMDPNTSVTLKVLYAPDIFSFFEDYAELVEGVDYGLARGSGYIGLPEATCNKYPGICDQVSVFDNYKLRTTYTYRGQQSTANGRSDYNIESVGPYTTVPDSEAKKQADILMPQTIAYVESLYRLFWEKFHLKHDTIQLQSDPIVLKPLQFVASNNDSRVSIYEWDFNYNGTAFNVMATGNNPTTVYRSLGTKTVALRTSAPGFDPVITTMSLDVAPYPFNVTYDIASLAPVTASTTPSPYITNYSWTFGDGTSAVTGSSAQHTYASQGAYQVRLSLTLDDSSVIQSSTYVTVGFVGINEVPVPGQTITGWETWKSGTTYHVTGSIDIARGAKLTIPNGAIVKLDSGVAIYVSGTLSATGVTFTWADGTNQWGGIQFSGNGSSGSRLESCILEHASHSVANYSNASIGISSSSPAIINSIIRNAISNAGYIGIHGIWITDGSPTVSGSTVSGIPGHGIHIENSIAPTISGCTLTGNQYGLVVYSSGGIYQNNAFSSNTEYGAYIGYPAKNPQFSGNTYTGNTKGTLAVSGSIDSATTWGSLWDPVTHLLGLQINSGTSLTISSGKTIKGENSTVISVYGTLSATGVTFTWADGTNQWGGIQFSGNGSSGSRLESCILEHASHSVANYSNASIGISSSSPAIINSIIRNAISNAGYIGIHGIWITDGSPTVSGSTVSGIPGHGIHIENSIAPTISGCTLTGNQYGLVVYSSGGIYQNNAFSSNTEYGLYYSGAIILNATNNNWGDPTGPLDSSDDRASGGLYNPTGKGNKVSDRVNYYPWVGGNSVYPMTPTGFYGTGISGAVNLFWKRSTGATNYKAYLRTATGPIPGSPFMVGDLVTTKITGLTNGTTYFVSLSSLNSLGLESQATNEITLAPNLRYTLITTITGTGTGSLHSMPGGVSCDADTCQAVFEPNTAVSVISSANSISRFGGWSGDCSGDGGCDLVMSADKAITATFNLAPKAKISTAEFTSLAAAYNSISSAAATTIMLLEDTLSVGVSSINRSLILQGGYKADFSRTDSGYTTLGPLTIGTGSVVMDRIVVQ